jgi:hypothetical protein
MAKPGLIIPGMAGFAGVVKSTTLSPGTANSAAVGQNNLLCAKKTSSMVRSWTSLHTIGNIPIKGQAERFSQITIHFQMKGWDMMKTTEPEEAVGGIAEEIASAIRGRRSSTTVTVNMAEYERQQAERARERAVRRELDPYGLGLWGPIDDDEADR